MILKSRKAFTPLEKATDFNRWSLPDGGLKPSSAQAVRERSSLTGFTLLELTVTIVLVSILIAALGTIYLGGLRAVFSQIKRSGMKGEAGRVFTPMAYELRQATSLTTTQSANLIFTLDSDRDGVDETVRYTWAGVAGNPFNRVQVSPVPSYTTPMVNSVASLAFSYYDANNTLLTQPVTASQVRAIVVDMTVTDGDETFQLRSEIKLRTL